MGPTMTRTSVHLASFRPGAPAPHGAHHRVQDAIWQPTHTTPTTDHAVPDHLGETGRRRGRGPPCSPAAAYGPTRRSMAQPHPHPRASSSSRDFVNSPQESASRPRAVGTVTAARSSPDTTSRQPGATLLPLPRRARRPRHRLTSEECPATGKDTATDSPGGRRIRTRPAAGRTCRASTGIISRGPHREVPAADTSITARPGPGPRRLLSPTSMTPLSGGVAQGVVEQVVHRLTQPVPIGHDAHLRVGVQVQPDAPHLGARRGRADRADQDVRGGHRGSYEGGALVRAGQQQRVLGRPDQPVGVTRRGGDRVHKLLAGMLWSARRLQLGLQRGQRPSPGSLSGRGGLVGSQPPSAATNASSASPRRTGPRRWTTRSVYAPCRSPSRRRAPPAGSGAGPDYGGTELLGHQRSRVPLHGLRAVPHRTDRLRQHEDLTT